MMGDMRTLLRSMAGVALVWSVAAWGQLAGAPSTQPAILARATSETGIYERGEKITFEVTGAHMSGVTGKYQLLRDGKTVMGEGMLALEDNAPQTVSATLDAPGWVALQIKATPQGGKEITQLAGAVVAPREITRSAPRPADFDEFWDEKIEEMKATPINAKEERVESVTDVEYYRVLLDGYKGSKVHGQLAKPIGGKADKKYPAMLIVQWAGVYPLQRDWVTWRAKQGFLALNILAHDEEFDMPKAKFDELNSGKLKDYVGIGNTSRDTSYFLRMYLSCYQAVQYLVNREDWNGEVMYVTGGSQGGLQAVVTAGLHPRVTHIAAAVPAGCGQSNDYIGGWWAWPYWAAKARVTGEAETKAKIQATAPYFDAVNFARRVRVPALVSAGLRDDVCPPPGVLAMVNELTGPVSVHIMPAANHMEPHAGWKEKEAAWTKAILEGRPVP